MNQLEILQAFLEDEAIRKKYGITQADVNRLGFEPYHSSDMIALLQFLIPMVERKTKTPKTLASNLNRFLDNRL